MLPRLRPWVVDGCCPNLALFFLRDLFCFHSGLVHQIAELVMAEMVLLCWSKWELLVLIKALKFMEVVGANMLAVTNVAICVNLALIVSVSRWASCCGSFSHVPCKHELAPLLNNPFRAASRFGDKPV